MVAALLLTAASDTEGSSPTSFIFNVACNDFEALPAGMMLPAMSCPDITLLWSSPVPATSLVDVFLSTDAAVKESSGSFAGDCEGSTGRGGL
jgi:hypothetical protein